MTTINIFITCDADDKISVKRTVVKKETPAPIESKSVRKFSEMENHILEIVAGITETAAIGREKFVVLCAEALPVPAGGRDNRMVQVSNAITDMSKGKDAPFREISGVIHFLVS